VLRVATVNRELACLRHMLKLAEDDRLIESAPRIKLDSERKFARKRVVPEVEYELLQASPRYLQRVLIGLYDTAMRKSELLNLEWNRVDKRGGVVRLRPGDTKEDD
jgi:integrase